MYNINGEILAFAIDIIAILFYQVAKLLLSKFKGLFKSMWLKYQLIKSILTEQLVSFIGVGPESKLFVSSKCSLSSQEDVKSDLIRIDF